jgi:hypothetical protein
MGMGKCKEGGAEGVVWLGLGEKYRLEGGGEAIDPRLSGLEQLVGIGLPIGGLLFSSSCLMEAAATAAAA